MRKLFLAGALAACGSLACAEFTYQQTSQMTGGALFEMMKLAGPFARQAREPNVSTVIVKGNRMATVRKDQTTIIDLDKESVTEIDSAKKQYSVVTFAQMKEAMEKAVAQAQNRQKGAAAQNPTQNAELNFKVSANATGQTKTINGINAKEVVLTMVTEATDKSTGQSGAMNMTIDNWLGEVPGYAEVQAFHRKMGEKMGYAFGSGMTQMAAMRPETLKGFEAAGKEMAKVEGFPVQSVMKMMGAGDGSDLSGALAQQQPTRQQPQQQQANQSASDAAVGAALGRLGIGGFGRNRNKANDQKQPPPQQAETAPAPTTPASPGSLIEMTTELTSFSPTADASKFEVPSGFKQVENEMVRRAR